MDQELDQPVVEIADAESGSRQPGGLAGKLIALIAGGWSLFQLSLPTWFLFQNIFPDLRMLNADFVRCIHLAFALGLVYLCFPAVKNRRMIAGLKGRWGGRLDFLFRRDRLGIVDMGLAILAVAAALYYAIDYVGIGQRQGAPIARDLIFGVGLIVLLLEAARRGLGLPLPIVAGTFILYSFVSEYMPDIVSFKNASLNKVVGKLSLSSEGIYGVPLDVSASTVFLFVLFGAMLEKAGGGQYFIQLAFSLLGRFKGGPAKAAVLASGLTGMVSGSSIANTVTTGTFTIPLMKRAGYSGIKAGAIEVAASTNGQLMPPVMGAAAFIIAELCNITYLEVVRAAFIPALISYLALIYITHLEACKLDLKKIPREELPVFRHVFWSGLHYWIPLGVLLYHLIIERVSAQLSAYYAIVALACLMLVRNLVMAQVREERLGPALKSSLRDLWESLVSGGRNMMSIGVAVAAAGIIVGIVTLGLGNVIVEVIDLLSMGNLVLLLLITALVSLILGMGLPTTANYIVMATLTAPAIVLLGQEYGLVVPLIAAHLFCFYFGILADDTPPVGLAAYAAAAISKEDPIKTGVQGFIYDMRTAILPFMFIFNTDLLLIGVDRWWHIALVFLTGMIAMFAFAALTQGFLIVRNRVHEAGLLILVTLILLRPQLFEHVIPYYTVHKFTWYAVGVLVFAGVHLLQLPRYRAVALSADADA